MFDVTPVRPSAKGDLRSGSRFQLMKRSRDSLFVSLTDRLPQGLRETRFA